VQRVLTAWARERRARGGAPIKVRIVKGANLAMERIEAAVHGWPQAPYETKLEVDANYKRMVEYGCRPEHAEAVHLGIASHNLFDVAYGLVLREARGVERWVEFEMLEGMANHQARAVQARAGGLLLYAPVVRPRISQRHRRFSSAGSREHRARELPAPCVRLAGLAEWIAERDRFLAAFGSRPRSRTRPAARRTGRRRASLPRPAARFENDPDTDWTLGANRAWIEDVVRRWRERPPDAIPLQVGGEFRGGSPGGEGRDPSRPGLLVYRYALAGPADVDRAGGRRAASRMGSRRESARHARACAAELAGGGD
jgi:RHH-type proline utilization regulon transcriptional repressor/proline dehydrogenase/delta 1-pyrroline-5-carboxylate dehydrogenase